MSPSIVANCSVSRSCNYYSFCLISFGLLWQSITSSSSSLNFLQPTFVITDGFSSQKKSARHQGRIWNSRFRKAAMIYATQQLTLVESSEKLGLYVHIPYCRRRCHYCNFAIVPIGSTVTHLNNTYHSNANFYKVNTMYEQAVLKELRLNEEWLSRIKIKNIQSIYFGGGTPSLAPIETLARIMDAIRKALIIDPNAEITIEMDPGKEQNEIFSLSSILKNIESHTAVIPISFVGTFDREKLHAIRNHCGFNRVSLGVQSMDDEILKGMGRQHTVQDVYDSMLMLREANITSISIDLICGQVPGLTLSKWATTLEKAANLCPNHMSVYDLQLEKGTIFDKWHRNSKKYDGINTSNRIIDKHNASKIFPTVEESAFMYKYTSGYLRSRQYEHYEISSYAAPARENDVNHTKRSQHNSLYWKPNSQWIGRMHIFYFVYECLLLIITHMLLFDAAKQPKTEFSFRVRFYQLPRK